MTSADVSEMGRQDHRVRLGVSVDKSRAGFTRQHRVLAEHAGPLGFGYLQRMMHHVTAENAVIAAMLQMEADRARCMAGCMLKPQACIDLMITIHHRRLPCLNNRQHTVDESVPRPGLVLMFLFPVIVFDLVKQVIDHTLQYQYQLYGYSSLQFDKHVSLFY